ncbi:hypothetical protein [Wolbachia endosymbiont of Oedothorax gibbosus]|uniref:hypothetical protein n=1 Tax=Wolbachia endosymbiont of Oedothorax gibbosus TaxID=931100 RepID=UPI0020242F37|nr:hypothetical protein [Wolbachia endosymbiont of Oedothorax gibbosus]
MPKNDQNEESTSILAKVGNFLGRGAKALGWGIIYPIWPKNWFKSWNEIGHDIKNGRRYVIGRELEKYDPPIETTQASENLGVQITEQKKGTGKVAFLASRTLTGDIPYLNDKQLGEIEALKSKYSNITIHREENKVVIEVDVEKIIEDIKKNNPGIDEKRIKELALEKIAEGAEGVGGNLKKLAKITGGEFKVHTDLKLLYGIAEKLYKEYDDQKQLSEATKPASSEGLLKAGHSSETLALSASDRGKALEAAETFVDSSRGELLKETANWQNKVEQGSENIRTSSRR